MMTLTDPALGELALDCLSGYVVTGFDLGFPEVRAVERPVALGDGIEDDTRFLGARAISVSIRFDQRKAPLQTLLDVINPYMSPRRRPVLAWTLPGSDAVRSATVSSRGAPVSINGAKFQTVVFQWVAPDGLVRSPDQVCVTIDPSADTELGRVYNENYADGGRGPYPLSLGVGERLITNDGNETADWVATIYGPAVNPSLRINGVTVNFNQGGGLTLLAGESIVIDTKAGTIWLNNDPLQPRFNKTNFTQWSWQSIRFLPGDNVVKLAPTGGPSARICYYHSWY